MARTDTESTLGYVYRKTYEALAGKDRQLFPWHSQYLTSALLNIHLKPILQGFSGRVLDAGCGNKPYQHLLPGDAVYAGIDVSNPKADFIIDSQSRWPFEDNCFDCIFSTNVIEHVENLELYLSELKRCLKPNGLLLIVSPFVHQEHDMPYDFRRYTTRGLERLFDGFSVERIEKIGGFGSVTGMIFLGWVDALFNSHYVWRVLKGLLLPIWLLVSLFINIMAMILNYIDPVQGVYNSALVIVRKRPKKEEKDFHA